MIGHRLLPEGDALATEKILGKHRGRNAHSIGDCYADIIVDVFNTDMTTGKGETLRKHP